MPSYFSGGVARKPTTKQLQASTIMAAFARFQPKAVKRK
jgi:hypothetical protein